MDKTTYLAAWDHYMTLGSAIFFGIGLLIFLVYNVIISLIKDPKERYDYVSTNEIRFFWYALLAVVIGFCIFLNSVGTATVASRYEWLIYVRLIVTGIFAIIAYLFTNSTVNIYYPRFLMKRLDRIRNIPRISPEGNKMRRLSEEEEDEHLEEHMIAEEESLVHSVDYDVWIDEKTGHKKIEKYFDYLQTEECPKCGYYTLKIVSEEVITPPTSSESGILHKHYKCSFCGHKEIRKVTIAALSANVA
ncbi:MAG: hypothetical protein KF860_01275 [Cyclobacteriaceae bacterium]|nr:hypothetical protein [Cyclobacteriaceae bacterium]